MTEQDRNEHFDMRIISLGAGVQSSTLYRMAALGEIPGPKPDYAIFADTKSENKATYETLDRLHLDHGKTIPILRPSIGDLRNEVINGLKENGKRHASVPFWVLSKDGTPTPSPRQCTREFKIDVVRNSIRRLLGLSKGERAKGRYLVEQWIGISRDEVTRAKPSPPEHNWLVNRWPLIYDIEPPMRRVDCLEWNEKRGFEKPSRSACTFCPYRSPLEFAEMRIESPDEFEEACQLDEAIRSKSRITGLRSEQFVLKTREPLRDLPPIEELKDQPQGDLNLFDEECEGMCGV